MKVKICANKTDINLIQKLEKYLNNKPLVIAKKCIKSARMVDGFKYELLNILRLTLS